MNVITAASWVMAVQRARMRRAGTAQRIAAQITSAQRERESQDQLCKTVGRACDEPKGALLGVLAEHPQCADRREFQFPAAGSLAGAGRTGDRRAMKAQVEAGSGRTFMPQVPGRTQNSDLSSAVSSATGRRDGQPLYAAACVGPVERPLDGERGQRACRHACADAS